MGSHCGDHNKLTMNSERNVNESQKRCNVVSSGVDPDTGFYTEHYDDGSSITITAELYDFFFKGVSEEPLASCRYEIFDLSGPVSGTRLGELQTEI